VYFALACYPLNESLKKVKIKRLHFFTYLALEAARKAAGEKVGEVCGAEKSPSPQFYFSLPNLSSYPSSASGIIVSLKMLQKIEY